MISDCISYDGKHKLKNGVCINCKKGETRSTVFVLVKKETGEMLEDCYETVEVYATEASAYAAGAAWLGEYADREGLIIDQGADSGFCFEPMSSDGAEWYVQETEVQ